LTELFGLLRCFKQQRNPAFPLLQFNYHQPTHKVSPVIRKRVRPYAKKLPQAHMNWILRRLRNLAVPRRTMSPAKKAGLPGWTTPLDFNFDFATGPVTATPV
jgi:hypothetical protein